MGKKSKRFKNEIKRAMACKLHPPETAVLSRQLEKNKEEETMNEEIRQFEAQHGFHETNDEIAIRQNLFKNAGLAGVREDWGDDEMFDAYAG